MEPEGFSESSRLNQTFLFKNGWFLKSLHLGRGFWRNHQLRFGFFGSDGEVPFWSERKLTLELAEVSDEKI